MIKVEDNLFSLPLTSHSIAISFLSPLLSFLNQEGGENTGLVLRTMMNSIKAAKMKPKEVSKK